MKAYYIPEILTIVSIVECNYIDVAHVVWYANRIDMQIILVFY